MEIIGMKRRRGNKYKKDAGLTCAIPASLLSGIYDTATYSKRTTAELCTLF